MPDLSQYISNTVQLSFKDGKVYVTDNSAYPAGVVNDIVGIIKITQPDKIVRNGDWNAPDIIYSGGSLSQGEVELRTKSNGKPQQGTYVIEYTVDHPDYTPTTLTRTFTLSYEGVDLAIDEQFDVFTPVLNAADTTDYSRGGFDAPTISRSWNAQIGSVGTVAGNSTIFDIIFSGNYYDAAYTITLTTDLTYQHSTYSYLTVVDRRTATLETSANTPPSYTTLIGYLKTIKQRFDELQSCTKTVDARQDYEYASALLSQIKSRICAGDFVDLYSQIRDFLNVYNNHVTVAYVNTDTPIATYDYSDVDCGGGGSGTTNDPRITSQMIANWNAAFSAIPPDDLEYIVGTTPGAPTAGTSTFVSALLTNWRIRLKVNKIIMSKADWNGNPYYSKPLVSDTLTLTGMTWTTGDLIQIERY